LKLYELREREGRPNEERENAMHGIDEVNLFVQTAADTTPSRGFSFGSGSVRISV